VPQGAAIVYNAPEQRRVEPEDPDEKMKIRRDREQRNASPRPPSSDYRDQPGHDEGVGRYLGLVAVEDPFPAHDLLTEETEDGEHDRSVDRRQAK
jgi:hypothetical protein